ARIGPCTGSVRLSRPQPQQIEGSHSGPLPRCSALCVQLSPGGCLVCYRRVSLLAARSRDGLLSGPTAGARHLCDGASDFGPPYRSSDPSRGGGIGPSRRPALASSVSSYQRVLRSSPSLGRKAMAGSVGFVGLGNMGRPMALNLVKAGFELVVHDIDSARLEPLVAAGATVKTSPEAVAASCHRTICMVETTAQAEAVILGERGIIQTAKQGDIVLCMSTIDPLAARRFSQQLAQKGVAMLDAPVSGGTHGAAAGTLSVIVGGPAETFAASEDLFRAMGKNIFHVGDLGHGLAMKLINNMLGQIATVAIAEALVFGKKAGLDPGKIFEVVSVSTGNSVQFQNRVPRMLARNFAPGGTIDISYKDQELETGYAKALGVPLLMANLSQQVYQMGRAAGLNKEDGSAIIKVFERMV